MRRLNFTVFDEFLTNVTSSSPVYTSQELNTRLAQFDQMAIFAVVDNTTAAGGVSVQIEHSGDGRNWLVKNGTAEINGSANNYTANATTPLWGSDTAVSPSLGFVRLKIWFNAGSLTAHLRIHVTVRDMGA